MAVHNGGGLIGKLLNLGDGDDPEDLVEHEETLPIEILDDDIVGDWPSVPSPKTTTRPFAKMRAIEEYLERKQLQEWLEDPLDESAY